MLCHCQRLASFHFGFISGEIITRHESNGMTCISTCTSFCVLFSLCLDHNAKRMLPYYGIRITCSTDVTVGNGGHFQVKLNIELAHILVCYVRVRHRNGWHNASLTPAALCSAFVAPCTNYNQSSPREWHFTISQSDDGYSFVCLAQSTRTSSMTNNQKCKRWVAYNTPVSFPVYLINFNLTAARSSLLWHVYIAIRPARHARQSKTKWCNN